MGISNYGKIEQGRRKKLRRRIIGVIVTVAALLVCVGIIGVLAGNTEGYQTSSAILKENHELKARVAELEEQVGELQMQIADRDEYIDSLPEAAPTPYAPNIEELPVPTEDAVELESPRE